jgi:hypothetical protein
MLVITKTCSVSGRGSNACGASSALGDRPEQGEDLEALVGVASGDLGLPDVAHATFGHTIRW